MKSPTLLASLLALLLCAASVSSTVPGFRTQITEKGLDYLRSVGVPILVAQLQGLDIPNISGKTSVDVLGTVSYSLSSIKLTTFAVPTSSLTLIPGVGLDVAASGASGHITAHWSYDCWLASDSGSADISISSLSANVGAHFGASADGHPTVAMSSCSTNIGDMSIDFHGGASWLYNLFSDTIAGDIKGSLNGQLCDTIKDAINSQGNDALQSLPVVESIDDVSEINFALLEPPTFSASYLDTAHKGEFFWIKNPTECPFVPAATPSNSSVSTMLTVWLTSYMADSAAFAYLQAGELEYTVYPDQVPTSFPLQLNTKSFQFILPQLYNFCPGCNMTLTLNATTPASLDIDPVTGLTFYIFGDMIVDVQNGSITTQAFSLSTTIVCEGTVSLASVNGSEIISGNATFANVSIVLSESNIGNFDVTLLQGAVNLVCEYGLVPLLNAYINGGFAIPTIDGASFVNPVISFGAGYIQIDTDVHYQPSLAGAPRPVSLPKTLPFKLPLEKLASKGSLHRMVIN